jgi:hypothetical protein
MKNKMLMVGAVSLVSLMTNVGFASTTPAQCTDDGAIHYVCRSEGNSAYWVIADETHTQHTSIDGTVISSKPDSDQCYSGTHIYYHVGGDSGVAPPLTSKGYDVGNSGDCYTISTAGVSMWKQAADLIPVANFR